MARESIVLFVYGSGGHSTAMHRLFEALNVDNIPKVQLIEKGAAPLAEVGIISVRRIMPKRNHYWRKALIPIGVASNIAAALYIFLKYDVKIMITTGPSIAIFPAILTKLNHREVVFIESWCRFESVSITGRILNFINCCIYYQNYEIAHLLPRGKYCGRL